MMGDPRSWGNEPDVPWQNGCSRKHGAELLPDGPLQFPPWLEDLRSPWTPE